MAGLVVFDILSTLLAGVLLTSAAEGSQQDGSGRLPTVISAAIPDYNWQLRNFDLQGDVVLTVSTNGETVSEVTFAEGDPSLSRFSATNVRTWRFEEHEPTTFQVTFRYRIVESLGTLSNDTVVVLRLPSEVDISAPPYHSPAHLIGTIGYGESSQATLSTVPEVACISRAIRATGRLRTVDDSETAAAAGRTFLLEGQPVVPRDLQAPNSPYVQVYNGAISSDGAVIHVGMYWQGSDGTEQFHNYARAVVDELLVAIVERCSP